MLFLLLVMAAPVRAGTMPLSLAGITLGEDVSTITHVCMMDTRVRLARERHLSEIQLEPGFAPGVKSGNIAVAGCAQVGRIVRIKLSFEDRSKDFFNDMLDRYKQRFGDPVEWRGDPFQTVMSWKWTFEDKQGRQVNLQLTHSEDDDYKIGNFVKMTLRSLWEEEDQCQDALDAKNSVPVTPRSKLDYDLLIPR